MQPEIMRLTARQLLTRGRLAFLVTLAALPPLIALFYTFSASRLDPDTFLVRAYTNFVFVVVAPVTALVFAAAALGSELEDGTIVYLLLKPTPRWQIVVSRLVVTVLIIAALVSGSIVLTAIAADRGFAALDVAFAFAFGASLGGAAYAAIFCFLGLITNRALIAGLLYVFIWEGLLTRLLVGARDYSVREYMRGIADAFSTLPNDIFDATLTPTRSLVSVAVVVVIFGGLAVYRLRTLNMR
jgi:ABC-2 type transport system permease protein